MSFVGLMMGGSPGALIAAGQAVLNLQWQAENREDTSGATFSVTGPSNRTVQAGTDGRASITVPAGQYSVAVSHKGTYLGDKPLTVKAESQKSYVVFFDGKIDRNAEIDARLDAMNTKVDNTVTTLNRGLDKKLDKAYYDAHAEVIKNVASKPIEVRRSSQNSIADLGIDITWSVLDTENLAGHTATVEVGGSVKWRLMQGTASTVTEFIKIDQNKPLSNSALLSGVYKLRGLWYLGSDTLDLTDMLTVRIILDDGRVFSKA